jgi:hypothetical protein
MEPLAADVDGRAVRQVAAVRQAHPEHRIPRLERCEEHRLVRGRPRMRLHIGEVGVKQLFRPVDRDLLRDIDMLASAVIAAAGIALGVLVRELRALRRKHGRARVVLGRDQLDVIFLPLVLGGDGGPDIRIVLRNRLGAVEHGGSLEVRARILAPGGARPPCTPRPLPL